MRMLIVFVLLIISQSSFAQTSSETDGSFRPRSYWASAEFLNWKAHTRGLDFAVTEDGSALALGAGQVHDVEYDRSAGFRTQLGVKSAIGWGCDVGFTHFGTEGRETVDRPLGTGQLFSSFSHPGGPEEADVAIGAAALDVDVFDLNVSYALVDRSHVAIDLFGGFRWADISQRIDATFDGRDFDNGTVQNESDVNAFGFRFGGRTRCRLAGGFSLIGGASCAALYGSVDSHRFETDFDGARVLVDLRDDYVQPVFNLDTSLGVGWQHNSWHIGGGYEMNVWTNLGDSLRFVDDIEEGGFAGLSGDLLLEGFFVRVQKIW